MLQKSVQHHKAKAQVCVGTWFCHKCHMAKKLIPRQSVVSNNVPPVMCHDGRVHGLRLYRSHFKEGRFLYKVGTLRNFANDLLRKIIITTLIS